MHAAGWTSWDESALGPCLKYVWGFKNNAIPEEWCAYNEAAKRNFPLGTFRGFTYLWKIGWDHNFPNFWLLDLFFRILNRRKTPTKRRKKNGAFFRRYFANPNSSERSFAAFLNTMLPASTAEAVSWVFSSITKIASAVVLEGVASHKHSGIWDSAKTKWNLRMRVHVQN